MYQFERIMEAVAHTHVIRPPEQLLATFGQTDIHYYLLTEPIYSELDSGDLPETVLREGHVIAEKPRIVTPYYMQRLEGFGEEARRFFEMMAQQHGAQAQGLLYTYKNEFKDLSILQDSLGSVAERINSDIRDRGEKRAAIIRGLDEMWDVSLFKFIYDLTEQSLRQNVTEMRQRGLLRVDERGVPAEAGIRIEHMFRQVQHGEVEASQLKAELDRWDKFEEYEDRFFDLFRQR